MMGNSKRRTWVDGVPVLVLAGLVGLFSGCGDSASNEEPKVTIASVDGDGNAPNEIETAIIVQGTNFEPGDQVEFCDAETGIRKTGGVTGQTVDSDTQITVSVDPSQFEKGATKTIVSRDGVPKAIKAVTYLSGPTYIPGPGIEVAAGDIIQTKLSPTNGLANDLGAGDELGIAVGGVGPTHLSDMGAADGQVLKWDAGGAAWYASDDVGASAYNGGEGVDVDGGTNTISVRLAAGGGLAGNLGPGANELGLVDGTAADQILRWNGSTWVRSTELDTLQSVCDRGNTLTGNIDVTGTVTATAFTGDGSGLSGVVTGVEAGPGIAVDNGVPANPIVSLDATGAAANDIMMWDGSTWGLVDGSEADTLQTVCDRGSTVTADIDVTGTVTATAFTGDGVVPAGAVMAYAGDTAPAGWLLCDGAAVSRAGNAALFAVIDITYGAGDGSTTFNLPDLRQRLPLGKAASGTGSVLGETGGSIDHSHGFTLTAAGMPTHSHSFSDTSTVIGSHDHSAGNAGSHGHSGTTGGAGSHNHTYGISTTRLMCGPAIINYWVRADNVSEARVTSSVGNHGHGFSTNTVVAHSHSVSTTGSHTHDVSGTTGGTGSGAATTTSSDNPPYMVVNYIIKQ